MTAFFLRDISVFCRLSLRILARFVAEKDFAYR